MKQFIRKLSTLLLVFTVMSVMFSSASALTYNCPNCNAYINPNGWVESYSSDVFHFQFCTCGKYLTESHDMRNGVCTACGYRSDYYDDSDWYDWCSSCDATLNPNNWDVYYSDADYHYQVCSCGKLNLQRHALTNGYCYICGYSDTHNNYYQCENTLCNAYLDDAKWRCSTEFPNQHYQVCTCGTVNYMPHVEGINGKCEYCGVTLSYSDYDDISVTISQDVSYYYFTDDDTESGYSVYELIRNALPYHSSALTSDYTVYFSNYSSTVGVLSGLGYFNSCKLNDLDEVYLSISSAGTFTADYVVTLSGTEVLSGRLYIEVEPVSGYDIIYSASVGQDVTLDLDDFYDFWDTTSYYQGTLSYVRINSVTGLNGTLCYNHSASEARHSSANSGTFYADPSSSYHKDLSKLTFVPSKSGSKYPTGTVTISFTAVGTSQRNHSVSANGRVIITYTHDDVDPIVYDYVNMYLTLNSADFNSVYKAATGSTSRNPSYSIKFLDLPKYGTLYYNYNGVNFTNQNGIQLTERNVDSLSFSNLSSGNYSISKVAYVPVYNSTLTDSVRYAVYSGNTLQYIGTITFNVKNTVITYGCSSEGVKFSSSDFYRVGSANNQYISFGTPSSGTLYKDYADGQGTAVYGYESFSHSAYSSTNTLDDLTYVPQAGYTGIVEIPFYANSLFGTTFSASGTVRIYVVAKGFSDVDSGIWYARYINRLYASGIVGGTGSSTFSPNANMKYGEALKMILIAAGYPKQVEVAGKDWAKNYLTLAYREGIVASTNIDLNGDVTRDAIAEIAAKAMGLPPSSTIHAGIIGPVDSTNGYVYALYNEGIVDGTSTGAINYFHGSSYITRAQVAKIICNIMDYKN